MGHINKYEFILHSTYQKFITPDASFGFLGLSRNYGHITTHQMKES